jgi:hypothetical protein
MGDCNAAMSSSNCFLNSLCNELLLEILSFVKPVLPFSNCISPSLSLIQPRQKKPVLSVALVSKRFHHLTPEIVLRKITLTVSPRRHKPSLLLFERLSNNENLRGKVRQVRIAHIVGMSTPIRTGNLPYHVQADIALRLRKKSYRRGPISEESILVQIGALTKLVPELRGLRKLMYTSLNLKRCVEFRCG